MKLNFKVLVLLFTVLFGILVYVFYDKTRQMALENAQVKINELLLNYKAFRSYVSSSQKIEVYRLQDENIINKDYFMPQLLSSTFSAKGVNNFYNQYRKEKNLEPIAIRFASDNPRNLNNKASQEESKILKQFNDGTLKSYSKIVQNGESKSFYYAIPTKRTTAECMRCHSDPKKAPKGLLEIYGDKNGFYEKEGNIRALLSTSYPLDSDLEYANSIFYRLTFTTLVIFIISLLTIYLFTKKIKAKNNELEKFNKNLDHKVKSRTKELENERKFIKSIVDSNPSIIIVTDGEQIISANKTFLELFKYDNLQEFKKDHSCICDYFVTLDNKPFYKENPIEGGNWCEYLVQNNKDVHKVTMDIENKTRYYTIDAIQLDSEDSKILINLSDITELRQKDQQLYEQSKLASMGEMIGNIAHQWRQPLSVISTGATGLKIQKEFGTLNDELFFETCDLIDSNAQFLSKTIDDFSNFIKGERVKKEFSLNENIESVMKLLLSSLEAYSIKIDKKIAEDIRLLGYPNELKQCLVNILNNAKDALKETPQEQRMIYIDAQKLDNNIVILISDTAGGISSDIIKNIFEPYFTTKHQSQGTGLGLSMTYKLITEGMQGTIEAYNVEHKLDTTTLKGAAFKVTIPCNC